MQGLPDVPKNATEMVTLWGRLVAVQVAALNRRPEVGADLLQAIWLRLIEADVVGKYHRKIGAAGSEPSPESFRTYLGTAVHNSFANWCRTQARRFTRERLVDTFNLQNESSEPESLFDLVTDTSRPCRLMEVGVDIRRRLSRIECVRGHEEDFLVALSEGYTPMEALEKLSLVTSQQAPRVRRILAKVLTA